MKSLLVLGSKPDPCLPDRSRFQAVACANASGYSAARQGLPVPDFTVISAIVTSGIPSGRQSLAHMAGLATGTLYYLPQPRPGHSAWKRFRAGLPSLRLNPAHLEWRLMMRPGLFRRRLDALPYRYRRFVNWDYGRYEGLIEELCGQDAEVLRQMAAKRPSTGVFAIALALSMAEYDRVIVAGFSFQLTHAYGENPEIRQRGTSRSRHADTDITILRVLAREDPRLFTTEAVVNRNTAIPMLPGD